MRGSHRLKTQPSDTHLYRTKTVARYTGATVRMLQTWDQAGEVVPKRGYSDTPPKDIRLYSSAQVAQVILMMELRSKGLSHQRIKRLPWGRILNAIDAIVSTGSVCHLYLLLSVKGSVLIESNVSAILKHLAILGSGAYLLSMTDAVNQALALGHRRAA